MTPPHHEKKSPIKQIWKENQKRYVKKIKDEEAKAFIIVDLPANATRSIGSPFSCVFWVLSFIKKENEKKTKAKCRALMCALIVLGGGSREGEVGQ